MIKLIATITDCTIIGYQADRFMEGSYNKDFFSISESDTSSPVAWCSCHVGIMVKWDNYAIAPLVKLTINTSFDQNGKHLTLRLTLC